MGVCKTAKPPVGLWTNVVPR